MDARGVVRRVRDLGTSPQRRPTYVFVVTPARAGSTLVQGLLNSLPRTLVRGENNFYVFPMFQAWQLARTFKRQHANAAKIGTLSAFYGLDETNPDDFIESTRDLVTRQLYGSVDPSTVDVLGFKEVLWHRVGAKQMPGFFKFFDAVFPDARYVLNWREPEQVVRSGFWRTHEEEQVMTLLTRVQAIQAYLRETRADRVHDTRYELLTADDGAVVERELRSLATFVIGRCDDAIVQDLSATLKIGHGPLPFGRPRENGDAQPNLVTT